MNNQNNKQEISWDLISDASVKTVEFPQHPGHYLLAFYIPRATREQMPVYKELSPFTGTYKRRDGGDYHCDPDAVHRMMADIDLNTPADSRILRGFIIDTARLTSGRALDFQGTLGHLYLLHLQVFSFHYGRQQLYMLTPRKRGLKLRPSSSPQPCLAR